MVLARMVCSLLWVLSVHFRGGAGRTNGTERLLFALAEYLLMKRET
jgi:hypothetical protein